MNNINPYIYIKQCEMNNCFDRKSKKCLQSLNKHCKTLKKPTRQRLKRSPRKQQIKATINWRTRPQRKNPINPPRPKQSPTRKATTRKFSLSKRRSPNCKENCKVNLIQRRQ
ncbi:Hypothetical_protein [Hexamita inflata]|uniref:Hypothetical_protein n=1 Tax=Hexamita inflata TaxID=28002 RepID=A0AA86RFQ2_9EUKA|nr:Hypothetical protein HINF_LOCUS60941 [Hexamita inflata]